MDASALTIIGTGTGIVGTFSLILWRIMVHNEAKRSRMYERLDEVREKIEREFVLEKVCDVRHQDITQQLALIKNDIKEIAGDIKLILKNNGLK